MPVTASAEASHRSSATARFGASAAYLLNEAASLARLRFAPPLGLGRDTKAVSPPRVGGQLISRAVRHLIIERKEINDAHFRTETESNSAGYVCQVFDARSGTLWAKPWGELNASLTAHDWKSSGAAEVAY